ncbi:MAG: homoserine dehydrogenase [Clostridia bacterium]|nr:homoserine dehydrogenase [Clostridia bacterium]
MAVIAVLGYGTVGSGVVEVINVNRERIEAKAGQPINIKYVLDLRDFPGDPVQDIITHNYDDILNDPEVEVVVEVMGGINPAYTFVKGALNKGKSVCTSNKELVAAHGGELMRIAKENNVNFLYEASVGGGIPIIRPINRSMTSDKIEEIKGILNGTTNYMLTKMTAENLEYADVLKNAQEKGYAERNPAADVEGFDACRKIAILASLATEKTVGYDDIYTEGITNISKTDIDYVKKMGGEVKLLARAKFDGDKVWAMVAPTIVMPENPLSMVSDVFNAILLKGNMLGDVMFYGKGAGKLPTASAVVSDIVEAVKHKNINLGIGWSEDKQELISIDDVNVRKFVRVEYNSIEEAKADVKKIFGTDKFMEYFEEDNEFAFVTNEEKESEINEKLSQLINCKGIAGILNTIRIEG